MPMYAMYASDILPPMNQLLAACGVLGALGVGAAMLHAPIRKAMRKFDRCAKCTHGKWCIFGDDSRFERRVRQPKLKKNATAEERAEYDAIPEQELFRDLPHDEQLEHARKCARGCKHMPTERCGVKTEKASVGECDHENEMCIRPKVHAMPKAWATIAAADTGKSFAQFVDVKTATESDREAHRAFIRKRQAAAVRRAAASSPVDDEDMDEALEPA